jgi:hypothetical protein
MNVRGSNYRCPTVSRKPLTYSPLPSTAITTAITDTKHKQTDWVSINLYETILGENLFLRTIWTESRFKIKYGNLMRDELTH